METYTLYDLNEYVKRVIALNFAEPIWISCEIAQCKNVRGNYYLDLVQQNEAHEVVAQSSAVLWFKNIYFLKAKLGDLLPSLLKEGVQIKIKVGVEFNERYGLKLLIEDIDPTYTLGQMELNRKKILERLKQEEVTELNKALNLPKVIQRLAVISSDTAAGYIDFKKHLEENIYGYKIHHDLYIAAMQGMNTDAEIVNALTTIKNGQQKYDVVVIIRGGGSKLDLAAFDSFNIGYAIATLPLPVFTGIGHEIDTSIADMMANKMMKTPTAVADFIIENNLQFEGKMIELQEQLTAMSGIILKNASMALESEFTYIKTTINEKIKYQKIDLDQRWNDVLSFTNQKIKEQGIYLNTIDTQLKLSDPKQLMRKGFVLVKSQNKYITSSNKLKKNDRAEIEFFDGSISAIVE